MPIPWGFRLTQLYIAREFELIAELFEEIPLADRDQETRIDWRELEEVLTSLRRVTKGVANGNASKSGVYSMQDFNDIAAGFQGVALAFQKAITRLEKGSARSTRKRAKPPSR